MAEGHTHKKNKGTYNGGIIHWGLLPLLKNNPSESISDKEVIFERKYARWEGSGGSCLNVVMYLQCVNIPFPSDAYHYMNHIDGQNCG